MKRLFRDLVAGALGMNIALFTMAAIIENTDLMLLGLISMALCGLGLNFSTWADDREDEDV